MKTKCMLALTFLCCAAVGLVLLAGDTASGAPQRRGRADIPDPANEEKTVRNIVKQGFPAGKADPKDLTKSDTAWEIEWTITSPNNGVRGKSSQRPASVLAIKSAKFMYKDRYGKVQWVTVLKNLELGEMFVPYDTTSPTFFDVGKFSFSLLRLKEEYLGPNCVAPGEILTSKDERMSRKVAKEVHDDGLRWVSTGGKARRGEKLMLWSLFSGGNYRYLIEYDFKDDGIIEAKVGATARNYFNRQKDRRDIHLHVGCWKMDMWLTDAMNPNAKPDNNIVRLVRRKAREENSGKFRLDIDPFNPDENGKSREGAGDWVPEEFTVLRTISKVRKNNNDNPHATAYDLIPLRYGSVRNYPKHSDFVNHDFWVTITNPDHKFYYKVPQYAKQHRSLENQPLTIWHNSGLIHVSRAEDFGTDGVTSRKGAAIASWAGFLLRPRNLFDSTPLYPQKKEVVRGNVLHSEKAKLTKESGMDRVRKKSYANAHVFKMEAGKTYTIDMKASFDTYLRLEDAAGNMLERDDDSGPGLNSRITYQPTKGGDYRIIATSFRGNQVGEYTLTIRAN